MKEKRRKETLEMKAANFTNQVLKNENVKMIFTEEANEEARRAKERPCGHREDLTHLNALTIDAQNTKDRDDAVSLERTSEGFRLGVHIADVASYVWPGSILDAVAMERGTSIYLPTITIPMLPGHLSNDKCSLNPRQRKNTLSVLIDLDRNGSVISYRVLKAAIMSRVKGVYDEVNEVIAGTADTGIGQKYAEVEQMLLDMNTLADTLRKNRRNSGANVDKNDWDGKIFICGNQIEIRNKRYSYAEKMIEEFMVLANSIIAEYMTVNSLPTMYRTQDMRNHLAKYETVKRHHAELSLECYVHYTSPIRRLADLRIAQVLSYYLDGMPADDIWDKYEQTIQDSCDIATRRGRRAKTIEKRCTRFCFGLFFLKHRGQIFKGSITGFDRFNNPLITIDHLGVVILGNATLNGCLGQRFSMKVRENQKKHTLCAYDIVHTPA